MLRQIMLAAAMALAALTGSALSAEAISLGGVTAPYAKFYSFIEGQSKGKPCTCLVPASVTKSVDKLMPGTYRTPIELSDSFFTIPTGCPGATCYLYAPEVQTDGVCDVFAFVPYEGTKVHLTSCQADAP